MKTKKKKMKRKVFESPKWNVYLRVELPLILLGCVCILVGAIWMPGSILVTTVPVALFASVVGIALYRCWLFSSIYGVVVTSLIALSLWQYVDFAVDNTMAPEIVADAVRRAWYMAGWIVGVLLVWATFMSAGGRKTDYYGLTVSNDPLPEEDYRRTKLMGKYVDGPASLDSLQIYLFFWMMIVGSPLAAFASIAFGFVYGSLLDKRTVSQAVRYLSVVIGVATLICYFAFGWSWYLLVPVWLSGAAALMAYQTLRMYMPERLQSNLVSS